MKKNSLPPIPPKMEHYQKKQTMEQRCRWNARAQDYTQSIKRILRKTGNDTAMDMSEPMLKRRIRAVTDSADRIIERYKNIPGLDHDHRDDTGEMWIKLNFVPATTYNIIEGHGYFLCAAAIWILDEILADHTKRKKLFQLLPGKDSDVDELYSFMPNLWHTKYDHDLILSVVYVLYYRDRESGTIEMDDENTERVITNSSNARGDHQTGGPHRKAYEELMSLIPPESVDRAVTLFKELFRTWTDRYFACAAPFRVAAQKKAEQLNRLVDDYNDAREELIKAVNDMNSPSTAQAPKARPLFNPLLADPLQELNKQLSPFSAPPELFPAGPGGVHFPVSPMARVSEIAMRMDNIQESFIDAEEDLGNADERIFNFNMDLLRLGYIPQDRCRERYGEDVAKHMLPIRTARPFEVCFALLFLIDQGSDLPWLYGCGCGLMEEISESLPWGIIEYKEWHDPVWKTDEDDEDEDEGEQLSFLDAAAKKKTVKPAAIPDWYERKYVSDDEDQYAFNRSLAQILYEETGCIVPQNMHLYDIRQKAVRECGVPPRETAMLLQLFTVLSNARRQDRALNLDEHLMKLWADETSEDHPEAENSEQEDRGLTVEELKEELKQARDENKKLRSSLYESEKTSRETRKELAEFRNSAETDRRELADLRELVFNLENDEARDEEADPADTSVFPYEVRKDTVVFGGHETWLKAIRPMLSGNIRFIDKDINFNVNIIRNTEIVWIQTNALSHSQYNRIVDAARLYKKTVRYFTYASASKGALQVLKADM